MISGRVKQWFGYTRKERRASLMLIILIIIVLIIRIILPDKKIEVVDLTSQLFTDSGSRTEGTTPDKEDFVSFDPNKAPYDTLVKAGFRDDVAGRIIAYRKKGGRFREPSDIRRIYGLDSTSASDIIPNIRIQSYTDSTQFQKRTVLELNRCDSAMLERLPGIGPVLSSRIIRYRNLTGGFISVEQLKEVYGLSSETFEKIRPLITADTALVRKTNLNEADYGELIHLPYLKRYQVTDILNFRKLEGRINSLDDLVKNHILTDSIAKKIKPYTRF
ncbi:MAG TPA: helix-hairpin-helix domain-containing protein [Bacteroidales bacterium]|nr:helix-hairpin-helix domain-containing protein [Bacteroidales bacterium]